MTCDDVQRFAIDQAAQGREARALGQASGGREVRRQMWRPTLQKKHGIGDGRTNTRRMHQEVPDRGQTALALKLSAQGALDREHTHR